MRILNTLFVDSHRARVTARGQAIEIREGQRLMARFPMAGLEAVLLTGRGEITSEAMSRCTNAGIRVAALSKTGRLRFVVGGPTSGNVLLRVAQLRRSDDVERRDQLAALFVAGKMQNQRRMLQRWASEAKDPTRRHLDEQVAAIGDRLSALAAARTGDHVRGLEGDATRRYFKGLRAHLERVAPDAFFFEQRSRRPPRDRMNALLSFVYGLVLTEVLGALDAVGLDPQVGFLHLLRPGRPALALDLLEELRPSVADRFAIRLVTRRELAPESFEFLPGGACVLTEAGRRKVLDAYAEYRSTPVRHGLLRQEVARSQLPAIQATLLARHIRGDLDTYPPYVIDR